jgi:hypothetical protein
MTGILALGECIVMNTVAELQQVATELRKGMFIASAT